MLYPDFNELVALGHKAGHLKLGAGRRSMAAASGDYASPFRGQGLAFHEVREYRNGDDIRSIDWRVTARTNTPHVKVFTEERERTVILCVDANRAMRFGTRGTFKSVQAARAAALLGWQANGSNDRVGCVVFGDVPDGIQPGLQVFAPLRSRQALWQALKLLSMPGHETSVAAVAPEVALKHLERAAPTGSLVLLISDFATVTGRDSSQELEKRLRNLHRRCDIVLIAVTDPADRELPAMATVVFADGSGRKVTLDTDNETARAGYAAQWRDNRAALETIASRQGIGILDLHTDKDVYGELLTGLQRLTIGIGRR